MQTSSEPAEAPVLVDDERPPAEHTPAPVSLIVLEPSGDAGVCGPDGWCAP